jgi:ATP/ADP translocase
LYLIATDPNRQRKWKYFVRPELLADPESQAEKFKPRGWLIAAVSSLGLLLAFVANAFTDRALGNVHWFVRACSPPVILLVTAVVIIYLIATDPNRK